MIVIHHSNHLFGFYKDQPPPIILEQGVSFFFVLSGFILAYVYPQLEAWSEIRHFWRARIARIWPALLASFILAFWLLSLRWDFKSGVANLLMVNAWIPFPNYFYSYNWVSWSISTEFFFYLAFPLLIYQWEKSWPLKLLASAVVVIFLILLSNQLHLPDHGSSNDDITLNAILFIHPASRIFEFIFGVCIATYWRKKIEGTQWSAFRASMYEIGVIILVGASMHFMSPLAKWAYDTWPSPAASRWLVGSGSMFAFGLLIYVMAMGRGRLSAWLSHPIPVLLGEISFSLYLLHQILLRYYQANDANLPHLPNMISYAIFWTILLLASYLMWALIEMPGRRLMLGQGKNNMHGTKVMQESWHSHLNLNWKTMSAAIMLSCLIVSIYPSK